MCGGNKNTTTQQSTSTTAPPGYIQNALQGILGQAQGVSQTPYNPATQQQVAGLTGQQQQAFQDVSNTQGIANPYISQATALANQSGAPISADQISNYSNPYQQQVINSTMAEMNQNNAMQQQQVTGNAAIQGALGGDRTAVAQSTLAGQQALSNNATLAGLNSQNYTQALGAAQADRNAAGQASYQMGNLGNEAQQSAYTDINQLAQAGNAQQQQQQNVYNAGSANAQAQSQYPFQTTQWLSGILGGLGGLAGGTTNSNGTTTTPNANPFSQALGLGLAATKFFADGGTVGGLGTPRRYDDGGGVDFGDPNDVAPASSSDSSGDKYMFSDKQSDALAKLGAQIATPTPQKPVQMLQANPYHASGSGGMSAPLPYSRPGFADGGDIADVGFDPAAVDTGLATNAPITTADLDKGTTPNAAVVPVLSPAGADFIKSQEGYRANAYNDGAQHSIGWGTKASSPNETISQDEAQRRFDTETGSVNNWINQNVKVPLTTGQRDALTSFGYNAGVGKLSALLPDINSGNTDAVTKGMMAINTQNGQPLAGLTNRRNAEAAMYSGQPAGSNPTPGLANPAPAAAPAADKSSGGLFGSNILGLSDNARDALSTAGFAMMASKSPNFGNAIGEGGLAGLQSLQQNKALAAQAQKLSNEADFHRIQLATQSGQLAERQRHNVAVETAKSAAPGKTEDWQRIQQEFHDQYPDAKPLSFTQARSAANSLTSKLSAGQVLKSWKLDENGNAVEPVWGVPGNTALSVRQAANSPEVQYGKQFGKEAAKVDAANVGRESQAVIVGRHLDQAIDLAGGPELDNSKLTKDQLANRKDFESAIGGIRGNFSKSWQTVQGEIDPDSNTPAVVRQLSGINQMVKGEMVRLATMGQGAVAEGVRKEFDTVVGDFLTSPSTKTYINAINFTKKMMGAFTDVPHVGAQAVQQLKGNAPATTQAVPQTQTTPNPFQQETAPAQNAPYPGAKQAPDGNWYVPDQSRPGKYLKVG